MHVSLVTGTTSSNMVRFLFGNPSRGLGDHVSVVRLVGRFSICINVARTSTSRRVGSIALVAYWAFTNNFAIGIGGLVGRDVGGTWSC